MNNVYLCGRVGRDPDVRYSKEGLCIVKLAVATNSSYKKAGGWVTETEWHNVTAFGTIAEKAQSKLKKGSLVIVEGRLKTDIVESKEGGKKYYTGVIASNLIYPDTRDITTKFDAEVETAKNNGLTGQKPKESEYKIDNNDDSYTAMEIPF